MRFFKARLPQLTLLPSLVLVAVSVYGFIALTFVISLTRSRMLPRFDRWEGFDNYARVWSHPRWEVAVENFAIFGLLYIGGTLVIGLGLAILLDQKIRAEGALRTIYLYPMALSFIVTGVAWQWLMSPDLGLQHAFRTWGWESFSFDWITQSEMAIYCVVIAGAWQASGFVMALFLAALRGINTEIISAARMDGASGPAIYWHIIIPALRPAFLTAIVVQGHLSIKSYDLVVALTRGGPGFATELPSTFMYEFTFSRNEMAMGAASAVMMLVLLTVLIVPYLYSELRHGR
ncbi:carbohydrate ABC transporter permease [Roseicyclus amphidinii]|uniref:carbohydrate ABC transporter permease n=1 Tax=Roseicyclus amphidinii TaxID=3034232 RepID=UPI0024E1307C|nr:sugar ABC transporter permease [Roseicyclus sp. Amp-Y-6]